MANTMANFTHTKLPTFADVFEESCDGLLSAEESPLIDGDCLIHGQICGNCSEEKESFTTLIQCGHSFCDQCFIKYIEVESKKPIVCCMQYQCSTPIDAVTALNFMEPSLFSLKIFTWKGLNFILKDENLIKECPTPKCYGRAFKSIDKDVTDKNDLQVQCGFCKKKWCFECQQSPHWPLSCDIAKLYKEYKFKKDEETLFTAYDLKHLRQCLRRCPSCAVLIEKNGGCESMFCIRCQRPFNWNKAPTKIDVTKFLLDTTKVSMRTIHLYTVTNCKDITDMYEQGRKGNANWKEVAAFYNLLLNVNSILESLHVLVKISRSRHRRRHLVLHVRILKAWITEGKNLLVSDRESITTMNSISALSRKILVEMNPIISYYC